MDDRAARSSPRWSTRARRVAAPHSPVSTLVTRAPVCVGSTASLGDAMDVMSDAEVSAVLVHGSDAILTEHDVTRALGAGLARTVPVAAVATQHSTVVPCDTTVEEAADLMVAKQLRYLVVDVRGEPAVVSMRDVLAAMAHAPGRSVPPRAGLSSPELWIG